MRTRDVMFLDDHLLVGFDHFPKDFTLRHTCSIASTPEIKGIVYKARIALPAATTTFSLQTVFEPCSQNAIKLVSLSVFLR